MGILDHVAIAAASLDEGVAHVEAALGVGLSPGGRHALMGTHNRLLSLGPGEYLEVIAIDPEAPVPAHPRWFALDAFLGPPTPRAWIVAVPDLGQAVTAAPEGMGRPMDFARGDLTWRMAVPASGVLPFDGVFPALIAWEGAAHPAQRLPDQGVRLVAIRLTHPRAGDLSAALAGLLADDRVEVVEGPRAALALGFDTPSGRRWLG